jgi:hypothetical protein
MAFRFHGDGAYEYDVYAGVWPPDGNEEHKSKLGIICKGRYGINICGL